MEIDYIKMIWEILDVGTVPASDEYMELNNRQHEIYVELCKELAQGQKDKLEEFIRLGGEMHGMEQEDAFSEGVSCGVGFVIDALSRRDRT